VTLKPVLK
jgi:hypothetical protein